MNFIFCVLVNQRYFFSQKPESLCECVFAVYFVYLSQNDCVFDQCVFCVYTQTRRVYLPRLIWAIFSLMDFLLLILGHFYSLNQSINHSLIRWQVRLALRLQEALVCEDAPHPRQQGQSETDDSACPGFVGRLVEAPFRHGRRRQDAACLRGSDEAPPGAVQFLRRQE